MIRDDRTNVEDEIVTTDTVARLLKKAIEDRATESRLKLEPMTPELTGWIMYAAGIYADLMVPYNADRDSVGAIWAMYYHRALAAWDATARTSAFPGSQV